MNVPFEIALELACEHWLPPPADVCTPPQPPEPRMKAVAESIEAEIQVRRNTITELEAEVRALEEVLRLLFTTGLTSGAVVKRGGVKPPPTGRKEKPVRAEKPKPASKTPRTRPGDANFAACGHPNTPENRTSQGRCKTCAKASQARWYEKNGKKAGKPAPRTPKPKSEPDPAPAKVLGPIVASSPASAPHAAAAAKWQGQCPMLDSNTGKRCSLQGGHPMPHSASGRTFSAAAAVNIAAMGGTLVRELDQRAMRGGAGA